MFASLRESRQVVTGETVQLCVCGALVLGFHAESTKLFSLQVSHQR